MDIIERDKRKKSIENIEVLTERFDPKAISYLKGFLAGASINSYSPQQKKEVENDEQSDQSPDNK